MPHHDTKDEVTPMTIENQPHLITIDKSKSYIDLKIDKTTKITKRHGENTGVVEIRRGLSVHERALLKV